MKDFTPIVFNNTDRTASARVWIEDDYLCVESSHGVMRSPLFHEEDFPMDRTMDNAWIMIKTRMTAPVTPDLEANVKSLLRGHVEAWCEDRRRNDPQYRLYSVHYFDENGYPETDHVMYKRLAGDLEASGRRASLFRKTADANPDNKALDLRASSWETRVMAIKHAMTKYDGLSQAQIEEVYAEANEAMSA